MRGPIKLHNSSRKPSWFKKLHLQSRKYNKVNFMTMINKEKLITKTWTKGSKKESGFDMQNQNEGKPDRDCLSFVRFSVSPLVMMSHSF